MFHVDLNVLSNWYVGSGFVSTMINACTFFMNALGFNGYHILFYLLYQR